MSRQAFPARSRRRRVTRQGALLFLSLFAPGCITWSYGLAPIHPKYDETVTEVPPTFEWSPSPEAGEAVKYQLVLYDHEGATVYEVADLDDTRHSVVASLPKGRYRWTVRAVHLRGDRWVPGPWSRRKYVYFAGVLVGWGAQLYEFNLPHSLVRAPRTQSQPEPPSAVTPAPLPN